MIDPQSLRLLEAVLFAAAVPLGERDLAARLPPGQALQPLLDRLQSDYQGRGVTLQQAGGFWAFRTAADLQPTLVALSVVEKKLSRAALETLAIIAYHQPVTRAARLTRFWRLLWCGRAAVARCRAGRCNGPPAKHFSTISDCPAWTICRGSTN